MSYKSILVLASGVDPHPAIEVAAWLAAEHDAVTHVLPVYPDLAAELAASSMVYGVGAPPQTFDAVAELSEVWQTAIETACAKAAIDADLVLAKGPDGPRLILEPHHRLVWTAIERACVLADLVVMSGMGPGLDQSRQFELMEEVLMRQRRPLLIVKGTPEQLTGPAAIAWNGKIEAARAVQGAAPMLGGASDLFALYHLEANDAAKASTLDLINYLKLHDLGSAAVETLTGEDIGDAILTTAQSRGAGLLVAGAYGHSRLREYVFGGVTRTLLEAVDGPSLLLAH